MSKMAGRECPPNGDSRRPAMGRKRGAVSTEEMRPVIWEEVRKVIAEDVQPLFREVLTTCISTDKIREMIKREVLEALKPELSAPETRICKWKMEASTSECLKLKFINKPSTPIYTRTQVEGTPIKGESSKLLQLVLVDANGKAVTSEPASSMEVQLKLIHGHFESSENNNGESSIVEGKQGASPLKGDLNLKLNQGKGIISNLMITISSCRSRDRIFRLVAAVVSGDLDGVRVEEAITDPFTVKEHRMKSRGKVDSPCSTDEVWKLRGISEGGKFCQRLEEAKIHTVGDFIKSLHENAHRLKTILRMKEHEWRVTMAHVEKFIPSSDAVKETISDLQPNPSGNISQAGVAGNQQFIQGIDKQQETVNGLLNAPIGNATIGGSTSVPISNSWNNLLFGVSTSHSLSMQAEDEQHSAVERSPYLPNSWRNNLQVESLYQAGNQQFIQGVDKQHATVNNSLNVPVGNAIVSDSPSMPISNNWNNLLFGVSASHPKSMQAEDEQRLVVEHSSYLPNSWRNAEDEQYSTVERSPYLPNSWRNNLHVEAANQQFIQGVDRQHATINGSQNAPIGNAMVSGSQTAPISSSWNNLLFGVSTSHPPSMQVEDEQQSAIEHLPHFPNSWRNNLHIEEANQQFIQGVNKQHATVNTLLNAPVGNATFSGSPSVPIGNSWNNLLFGVSASHPKSTQAEDEQRSVVECSPYLPNSWRNNLQVEEANQQFIQVVDKQYSTVNGSPNVPISNATVSYSRNAPIGNATISSSPNAPINNAIVRGSPNVPISTSWNNPLIGVSASHLQSMQAEDEQYSE